MYNSHWGGVVENNHFGTHEFFDLCELIGTDAYVCGNVGSGSVQEMMEWVEYMTSNADSPMANLRRANGHKEAWKIKYFAVGNELAANRPEVSTRRTTGQRAACRRFDPGNSVPAGQCCVGQL